MIGLKLVGIRANPLLCLLDVPRKSTRRWRVKILGLHNKAGRPYVGDHEYRRTLERHNL